MALTGIDEEIGLGAGFGTGIQELQCMLRYHRGVVHADDNLQLALQVFGLVDKTRLLVALRILFWRVHITLTVHHLVPFPVDNRAACHTHLEDLGISGHQRCSHKAAKAPSVNTYSVGIHIGKALQIVHTAHLVAHLHLTQMTESSLLEVTTAVLAASVVEYEQDIALLGHVGLPTATGPMPGSLYAVCMRTAIDVNHSRIFLVGIEVGGLYHTPVQVGHPVVSLDAAHLEDRLVPSFPRVGSCL